MRLSELKAGESATVVKVLGHGGFRRRIMEMGFVRGSEVEVVLNAPLRDPIQYKILGYSITLRRAEAQMIEVITEAEAIERLKAQMAQVGTTEDQSVESIISRRKHHINIALVGNPNSGKTSLFNRITGANEHVGNYSGVTVGSKSGRFYHGGYEFHITDLPGTYALSAYSPEERFVREHLVTSPPDVVLNVVCSSNIERNLYLTTELIDMSQNMVVALNMYDELEASGDTLDYQLLGQMMGTPMIPVVSHTGRGIEELLDTIIAVYEGTEPRARHIHINQGIVEQSVTTLARVLKASRESLPKCFPPRYFAMKLLENDSEVVDMLKDKPAFDNWMAVVRQEQEHLASDLDSNEDIETTFANQKYGFISGALRETYHRKPANRRDISYYIDEIVTHRIWGYPIFIALMWLMFYCTFSLGQYPQQWLESGVALVGRLFDMLLPAGILRDLVVDGVIGGVGSVIVFLPNIVILYLFISFMEDSGYLARASFIMDKLMHKTGLHGKSFIPLIMGFGCNVPAVMATRTIESPSVRLITALIIPFTSCSARLPIYVLFLGTFFGAKSAAILFGLYLLGIVVAILTARLLRRVMTITDDTPFVMELPPYRVPTMKATLSHMWERCAQYLRKMGGLILVASVVVWALTYFPMQSEGQSAQQHYENSYMGRIGKACEPVFRPMGLNWKSSVAIVSGVPAKEIVLSTLGVLYADNEEVVTDAEREDNLRERLVSSGDFTTASVLAFLTFILLYFPCLATLAAIASEYGKRWALASVLYSTTVAWILAFLVYRIVQLI
ncbi:MAG: ferrous iron transport protein B [Alistipes sp.]|nr:ferrous iron transport protein B [Alistipes sp.]